MLRKMTCFLLATVVMAVAGSSLVNAASPATEAADNALDYIRGLQNADGGFPDLDTGSSTGATLDAVFAFAAAGIDAGTVKKGGNSPLDYLKGQATSYSDKAGPAAKLVLGLAVLGRNPRNFAGTDLLAKMESYFHGASHSYGDGVFDHCLYMLARSRLGLSPAPGSADHLKSKQTGDGCWEYGDGWGCDTNTTALAIQALTVAGVPSSNSTVRSALDYLAAAQNSDSGWPYDPLSQWGTDSDANSTAFVIQALVAAGEDIDTGGPWEKQGNTPLEALLAFQNPQTGAFTYGGQDNAYATYQAVPALLLKTYSLPAATPDEAEETATPKPTKTPTPTATPTVVSTATPPPTPSPVAVILPLPTAPVSEVAPIVVARTGDGSPAGDAGGVAASAVMTSLLAAGGALMIAGGLVLRIRRR